MKQEIECTDRAQELYADSQTNGPIPDAIVNTIVAELSVQNIYSSLEEIVLDIQQSAINDGTDRIDRISIIKKLQRTIETGAYINNRPIE